jgi:hypothetical protein
MWSLPLIVVLWLLVVALGASTWVWILLALCSVWLAWSVMSISRRIQQERRSPSN